MMSTRKEQVLRIAIAHFCGMIFFASIAQAQTMYRCGSSYQDKPCANGQTGVVIGKIKTNENATADGLKTNQSIDPACKARGEEAKKILWMREGGAQKTDLLAKSESPERDRLINDIYAVRGNSNDIRMNIERNCMEEKLLVRRILATSDPETLNSLQAARSAQNASNMPKNAQKSGSELTTTKTKQDEEPAPKMQLSCPKIKVQMAIVNANLQAGADAASMQEFRRQKQELESELRNCKN
ncbi:hypothetical protein [Undibacterium fentianense]|uniref:DUF4124 domain-containing protein n=1 Tax=Undibacterium fentianense TaxID=2828728 RepID=A0A941E686_9BURK|nr:hypothetical protein [Undibacterium fentianense]MBR7801329.1 hypothetical protein [Undibacterium fentianense]